MIVATERPPDRIINGEKFWWKSTVAEIYEVSERTVDRWYVLRIGPARAYLGSKPVYRIRAVLEDVLTREAKSVRNGGHRNK